MPLAVAVMVTLVLVVTALVLTVKVPLVAPAAMVMLPTVGLATAGLLLESVTVMAPGAAAASSVTVPVALDPPATGLGLSATALTPMGRTVSVVCLVKEPVEAVIVTGVLAVTG